MAVGRAGHCAAVVLDHDAEVVARVTERWARLRISGFERRKWPGPKDLPAQ